MCHSALIEYACNCNIINSQGWQILLLSEHIVVGPSGIREDEDPDDGNVTDTTSHFSQRLQL